MKKRNLVGQKFNMLTVISSAPKIKKDNAWNCRCDCGKIIIVRTKTLTCNEQKSCGCLISKCGKVIKIGDKFHKLTAISYESGFWDCLCECGNKTTAITHHLISGNTKSCGCLKTEKSKINIQQAIQVSRKYEPRIASARRRWKSYCYSDKNCTLTFDQ